MCDEDVHLNENYTLRKSVSDPTDLRPSSGQFAIRELDRCLSLLSVLNQKVDQAVNKMPGNCKWCHGPTGSQHVGSKWGYDICKLPHSSLCTGGVSAIDDKRSACPTGYEIGMQLDFPEDPRTVSVSDSDTESDPYVSEQNVSQLDSETDDGDDDQRNDSNDQNAALKHPPTDNLSQMSLSENMPAVLSTATSVSWSLAASSGVNSVSGLTSSSSSAPSLDATVLQIQLAEMQKQQALQVEKDRVRDKELAGVRKQLEEAKKAPKVGKSKVSAKKVNRRVSFSSGGDLTDHAAKLAARAQRKATKKVNEVGIDIEQIRKTAGMSNTVDEFMKSVTNIPSLSVGVRQPGIKRPNPASGTPSQHLQVNDLDNNTNNSAIATMLAQQQAMMTNQMKMFMDFQQQQELIRQQQQLQLQALMEKIPLQSQKSPSSAEKRAAQNVKEKEDNERRQAKIDSMRATKKKCEEEYEAALKHVEKARRAKKKADKLLAEATESDETDADQPSNTVTRSARKPAPSQFSEDSSDDSNFKKAEKKKRQKERRIAEQAASSQQSASGLSSSAPVPRGVKQGRTVDDSDKVKQLSISDWAKLCPVKYSSSCTDKNINLPMWVWGKLAEIRAALAGNITHLVKGELEARLRHMQCVLEVCNQNSSPTEYTPYGWCLARNYDARVQAMMDTKVSDWVSFNSCFNMGPHPSFFLSAMNEVEKVKKKDDTKKEDPKKKRTVKCETFNACKTKKRCEYEVTNPSTRCKKLHECSYCWKNRQESNFHQWWDCGHGGRETYADENQ